jgi:hypothetical protein
MEELNMTKLLVLPIAGLVIVLAILVGAHLPPSHDEESDVDTQAVCTMVDSAISAAYLGSPDAELNLKLAAARPGVPAQLRDALDAYYANTDKAAGRQALLIACADAGYPVQG